MFDLERLYPANISEKITLTRQQSQRVEDRQRDIYESHRHRTFSLAFYMTGNEIEAERILTNTFVTAFQAVQEPNARDVDSALIGELQERFPLGAHDIPAPYQNEAGTGSDSRSGGIEHNVRRTDLEEAIQELPAQERLVFLLRDVEGYAPAAVAQLLKVPETQINRSLFSARLRLRNVLATGQQKRSEAAA